MTMNMNQILNFQNFYMSVKDKKMSLKTAYKLSKLIQKIETELTFYNTKFQEIVNAYGKKDENGNYVLTEDGQGVQIIDGKMAECQKEINDLGNLEVEIEGISFTLEELESFEFTVEEMFNMMPFIKE